MTQGSFQNFCLNRYTPVIILANTVRAYLWTFYSSCLADLLANMHVGPCAKMLWPQIGLPGDTLRGQTQGTTPGSPVQEHTAELDTASATQTHSRESFQYEKFFKINLECEWRAR
jgi:hypothetical protein